MVSDERTRASDEILEEGGSSSRKRTRWIIRNETVAAVVVVYSVFFLLTEAKLWRPGVLFSGASNSQIAEAEAWWDGHLDLDKRHHDTALSGGKAYSHFPVLFSIVSAGVVELFGGVPHWFVVLTLALPIPLLCFVLFRRVTKSAAWGAVFGIAFVCGTSLWPVLDIALRSCRPYHVNHSLAVIGLLILLTELYGRQRVWVAGLGLLVASLARQLTAAFAIPVLTMVLLTSPGSLRRRRWIELTVVGVLVVGFPLLFNALKFGNPLTTGYMLIYEDRDIDGVQDRFAQDAHEFGLFSPHFVPRNLYYANVGLPNLHSIKMEGQDEYYLRPNYMGTGIWWTTPLLLWLLIDFKRIWRDPISRSLLASVGFIFVAHMFFHATGADQRGYNRFSLDYMLGFLVLVIPAGLVGKRRWISLAMVGWSVLYFRVLINPPPIRIW